MSPAFTTFEAYSVDSAVDQIARAVLTASLDWGRIQDGWGEWPRLSEDDWRAVLRRVNVLIDRTSPQSEKVSGAYEYLAAREGES